MHIGAAYSPPLLASPTHAVRMSYLVQPLVPMDMFDFLSSQSGIDCAPKTLVDIFEKVISLLLYLKEVGIHYFDVKPENVLLREKERGASIRSVYWRF